MPTATPATAYQKGLLLPFERDVREHLHRIRSAIAAVISEVEVARGAIHRATDLQRALGIRSTLAWRIHRFIRAEDPLQEAMTLPGVTAMSRFFDAARNAGVAVENIQTAELAMRAFDELIRKYADTRATFDSMLTDLAGTAGEAVELGHRRAAFNANSHIWGVQASTRFVSMLYHRADADDALIDVANIDGVMDLRQLRANRPFVLTRTHVEQSPGDRLSKPIDSQSQAKYGVSVLPQFCSTPAPHIETYASNKNELVAELVPTAMGKSGAVSAVLASHYKNFGYRFHTPDVPSVMTFGCIDTPYEVCIVDILIEDGAYGDTLPGLQARIVGGYAGNSEEVGDRLDRETLWRQAPAYLGQGTSVLAMTEVSRYPDMVKYVADRLRWDAERFHVFRCRIEYPVMPSVVNVGFDIPYSHEQLRQRDQT